ncbi:MAG: pyridoxamine 5'-phosphate oxidase family protein [Actinomycetota bacterium]
MSGNAGSAALDTALRCAATAELIWVEDATPRARAVVPLLADGHPVVAATYADAEWARSLATRPVVVLTLSDRRMAAGGWRPLAVTAAPRLVEDVGGAVFAETLLPQELRKHPPSRALADSALLRRENWWYLPRLLLHLDVVRVEPFAERTGVDDALLATVAPDGVGPVVQAVRVESWERPVRVVAADGGRPPDAGTALLFGHDLSVPDAERWVSWEAVGPLAGGLLDAEVPPSRTATGMPRLRERMRRHKDLRKGCVAGIRAAEARG